MHIKGLLLLLLWSFSGCGRTAMDPAACIRFLEREDHGFRKDIVLSGWQYQVQYRPAELILSKEASMLKEPGALRRRRQQLAGMVWFNITIRHEGDNASPLKYQVSGLEEYNSRNDYFLNRAAADLSLQYGGETLHPASYWFETNYGLTPGETMVVAFRLPGGTNVPERDMTLCYHDKLLGNGIIKTGFPSKLIQTIPELIIES